MPNQAQEYKTFKGLLLPFDRKRVPEPYVVDGQNFLIDVDGPHSGFARTYIDQIGVVEPRAFQTQHAIDENDTLIFAADSILKWNVTTRQLYPVYTHATRTQFWPWTRAVCGRKLYLCNKEVGLLSYDDVTGYWIVVSGVNIPTDLYACCESFGRLVLLSQFRVTWSMIDDGTNTGFAPSLVTGAGFQGLSILASRATPLMLLPYDGGFLVYCQQGILRGELVKAANPFRFSTISREHSLLNPWAVTLYGEENHQAHVFLTDRGMFMTFGDARPVAFENAVGEWLHRTLLPSIAHDNNEFTTALSYNIDTGWFAVSIATDSVPRRYNKALVLYQPSGEWGWLNRAHAGLAKFTLTPGTKTGRIYGMCDTNGGLWYFTGEDSDIVYPTQSTFQIDVREYIEFPPIWAGVGATVGIFSDMAVLTDEDITFAPRAAVWNLQQETGEFVSDASDTTAADETPDTTGSPWIFSSSSLALGAAVFYAVAEKLGDAAALDSFITIGPVKIEQQEFVDYLGQLQELVVSMGDAVADTKDVTSMRYVSTSFSGTISIASK